MNFTGQPITLPLYAGINRCLGHGEKKGEWCNRIDTCACHQTIQHDAGINAPAAYRKCMSEHYAAYLPMEGFPFDDTKDEGRPA